jgi:hypothetical protein
VRPLPLYYRLPALWVAISIPMAATAWAAEEIPTRDSPPTQETAVDLVPGARATTGIRLYGEETISVLADFGAADASEFRSTLGTRASAPISDSFLVRVRAVGEAAFYDYDGDRSSLEADLGLGDMFERLYDAEFALGGAYRLPVQPSLFGYTPSWAIFVEGSADLAWEDGASLSEAVAGSGAVGVGFELDPHLKLALGVDVGSKIDGGGVKASPVFDFRWQIRDDMRLESKGVGLMFAYDLIPELQLQLRAAYDRDRYRLRDDDGVPDQTLGQTAVPLLVALRWAPTPHWRIIGGAGSVVYQKWKVELDDKPDLGPASRSEDAGPAPLVYFRLEHRF